MHDRFSVVDSYQNLGETFIRFSVCGPPASAILMRMQDVRIDFHVHSRISPDGLDAPEVVVERAKSMGLGGICLTDHDRRGGYDRLVRLGLADPSGDAVDGFLVIPGVEVSTRQGHVLVIGAAWDTGPGLDVRDVVRHARARGAIAAPAHPFDRFRSGVGRGVIESLELEAVEAFNSKSLDAESNRLASAFAERSGAAALGGSDAHFAAAVGRAYTVVTCSELSVRGVLAGVRERRTRVVEGLHSRAEVARYLVRGWLTRPWLVDWTSRAVRGVLAAGAAELPEFEVAADESPQPAGVR